METIMVLLDIGNNADASNIMGHIFWHSDSGNCIKKIGQQGSEGTKPRGGVLPLTADVR